MLNKSKNPSKNNVEKLHNYQRQYMYYMNKITYLLEKHVTAKKKM